MEIELQILAPEATVTSQSHGQVHLPSVGTPGRWPEATGYTLLNPGLSGEADIGRFDVLHFGVAETCCASAHQEAGDTAIRWSETRRDVARDVPGSWQQYALEHFRGVSVDNRFAVDEVATGKQRARCGPVRTLCDFIRTGAGGARTGLVRW